MSSLSSSTGILQEDWEFNILDIENYRKPGGRLFNYFNFITENHSIIPGDICEIGVNKGRSLLAAALLLKELGSRKLVWGFDSFGGFPRYHKNDDIKKFRDFFRNGTIDSKTYNRIKLNIKYRSFSTKKKVTPANISLSGDFSSASIEELRKKIKFLKLDNVRLVKGPFSETMNHAANNVKIPNFCAALFDCDLYESYRSALPYVWGKLSQGGYIAIDEYYSLKFPGARIATDEFFTNKKNKPQKHRHIKGDFERWFVRKIFEEED